MSENDKEDTVLPQPARTITRDELERALEVIRAAGEAGLALLDRQEVVGAASLRPPDGPGEKAYETFLRELSDRLGPELWSSITVTDQKSWVQLAGLRERVYVAKSAIVSPHIESTLEPELIEGAESPERRNGKIKSLLPSTVEAVAQAVTLIAAER